MITVTQSDGRTREFSTAQDFYAAASSCDGYYPKHETEPAFAGPPAECEAARGLWGAALALHRKSQIYLGGAARNDAYLRGSIGG